MKKYLLSCALAFAFSLFAPSCPLPLITSSKKTPGTVQIFNPAYQQVQSLEKYAKEADETFTFATEQALKELSGFASTQAHKKALAAESQVIKDIKTYFEAHLNKLAARENGAESTCNFLIKTDNLAHIMFVKTHFQKRPGGFNARVIFVSTSPTDKRPDAIINLVTAILVDDAPSIAGKAVAFGICCVIAKLGWSQRLNISVAQLPSTKPKSQPRRDTPSVDPKLVEQRDAAITEIGRFGLVRAIFLSWLELFFKQPLQEIKERVDAEFKAPDFSDVFFKDLYSILFVDIPAAEGSSQILDAILSTEAAGAATLTLRQMNSTAEACQKATTLLIEFINKYDKTKLCKSFVSLYPQDKPEVAYLLQQLS